MFDGFIDLGGGVIPVLMIVVVLVLVVAYMGSRYKVAGANEALIVSGRRERGPEGAVGLKVVRGQGVIVLPLINKVGRLHLSARQINVQLSDAVTKQGIKVAVQGVATVKIGSDEESIRAAAERFLEREDQIDSIVKNVLEGSLRSIVGTLTVEELNYDRAKFQQEVQSAARSDLATSGLTIDNFTIQAIRDEVGYMDLIGQQETARRERDARMAKAQADQEAAVREAEAQQVKLNAQRDVSLRQAEVEALTQAAEAKAAQAGPLAQAEATQEVTRKQTELAQLEADRKQKELIATTIRPAEAEADAQVRRAEGDKLARIAQAQAEAERVRLAGQAEANIQVMKGEAAARVTEVNAEATAKQTTLEGNAEAGIVLSKGEAEAKALALRADAYRQFNEAAVIQTVLSMLPEIVRAAAEPMGRIDQLTVLSNDGASELVRNTTRTVTEASATVKGLTGIDVPALIGTSMGARFGGSGGSGGSGKSRGGGGSSGGSGGGSGGGGGSRSTSSRKSPEPPAPRAMATPASATAAEGSALEEDAAQDVSETMRAAVSELDRTADRARRAVDRAIGQPVPARTAAPAASTTTASTTTASTTTAQSTTGAASSAPLPEPVDRLGRTTTLSEAAEALADDLMRIPGIQRFGGMRLQELESSGPRPLRTMWRIARDKLERDYGQLTIGEIIDRYQGGSGGTSASA
ncbi:MAG TPA: SPFH domain-containing protein [Candidatus Limnocylindrales bacterium]|nr:SPFH domain-containing protein [Candidatus Limnocylindrales bacterium]